jgi:S-formylglutathione hydrolase FrmB
VRSAGWIAVVLLGLVPGPPLRARGLLLKADLDRVNRGLHGRVVDYTNNHGADRALPSPSLGERRDLYVYLPPDYDPALSYPLILWLHGFSQDEESFIHGVVQALDRAIDERKLPPVVVAAPDGSLRGVAGYFSPGSFFLNSRAGAFEDYLMKDVWEFLLANYSIRPEREAHVIAGASMGGGAAFNKAIKYPDRFGVVVGFFPPVNLRWEDCHGRYMADFDPCCWGWREDFSRGREVVGRFYVVVPVRARRLLYPLYGRRNPETAALISRDNPIEMLDAYDVRPGQLEMFIAYGGRDQFNIDAQVESFLYVARERGLEVGVAYDPRGKHDMATAMRLLPATLDWLGPRLMPYGPTP